MKKVQSGLLALSCSCLPLWAQGQSSLGPDRENQVDSLETQQLDEVVVSDSRFALKRENSGKTVIQINPEELEANPGRSVAEIINTKSGIETNGSRSFAGQNISTFVRGGNNRQVLVIIDGIQVSDPSGVNGEYDLRLLNTSQIERIEIVKGASSTLYGNSAATAVISITTKKASKDRVSMEVLTTMGTNQSQSDQDYDLSDFSNTVTLQLKRKKLSVLASGGHQYTDGISSAIGTESDPLSRLDGSLKIGYGFSERLTLTVSTFYNKLNSDFDNGFPIEDADFSFRSEQSRFGLSSTFQYKNGSINLNGAFNQITRSFQSSFPSAFDSESLVLDVFNKYNLNGKVYSIVGLNLIDNTTFFSEDFSATTTDPYANLVYVSTFGLNLNLGARLNNHSEYGSNLIYNFNPSYSLKIKEGYLKFLGSYATSFIAPNLSQLFGPFGPNPELRPEENTTLEVGVEYRPSENIRISALYFNRSEENRIDFVLIDPDTFESQYQNLDETTRFSGVEVELEAQPMSSLSVTANYTYTDGENGLALRIPQNKVNATLSYNFGKKTTAGLAYQYVAERTDTDFSTFLPVDLEAFTLVNLYAQHSINETVGFFFGVDNLFNTDYFEIIDFTTLGRNVRLGMRLKF